MSWLARLSNGFGADIALAVVVAAAAVGGSYLVHFNAAFPDARLTEEDLIAEEEKVVTRWTLRGTHQGGYQGIPATGRSVVVTGIAIDRIRGGQVVEHWVEADFLSRKRFWSTAATGAGQPL